MKLTESMRDALRAASKPGGVQRRDTPGPGKPPWPFHHATLYALTNRELVEHDIDLTGTGWLHTWTITDAGREALKPREIHKVQRPRYLAHDGRPEGTHLERIAHPGREDPTDLGYTTRRARAVDDAGEVLDPPDPEWKRRADRRHARDQDPRERARRKLTNIRAA